MKHHSRHPLRILALILLLTPPVILQAQGTVLLVIGSDTGTWDGLDVNKQHCTIGPTLYTDTARNASHVMDPAFRGAMTDYFGTPMKLTWWMMAGNMFRASVNTDVPTPSTLPIYLMKRYEGSGLERWGDELTFHFHDWYWSDENGDGIWYWNQAPSFSMVVDEFDQTLAEMLIEEDLFPVSFRSGWHAMDNGWQHRLNEILPFSMHNDYPARRSDPIEPVDNVYDWSRAPSTWIPFHPSTTDYQVPGDGPGWNLRSRYMSVADSAFMANIFAKASAGEDQVVCLWAHLPETDFLANLEKVNRSAHLAAAKYPTVPYRYCTAVEAMQRWRRTSDTTKPVITLTEQANGENVGWTIQVDEPIFQPAPIVAVKDRYEDHRLLSVTKTGPLTWQTTGTILRSELAEVAVAATDTSGNLSKVHQRYLPADIFVDNGDAGYSETAGTWSTTPLKGWGASFRSASVSPVDSAAVRWTANVSSSGLYSIFLRIPAASVPAASIRIRATNGATLIDSVETPDGSSGNRWWYVATAQLDPAVPVVVEMTSRATGAQTLTADVMRITPLVRDVWVHAPEIVYAGDLTIDVGQSIPVVVENSGILPATIVSASVASGTAAVAGTFPRTISPMSSTTLQVVVTPTVSGSFSDTLLIGTDDSRHPQIRIPLTGRVREYFAIVDNGDSAGYSETGTWYFSNATAYQTTSRYSFPVAGNSATFGAHLSKAGAYDISEIVPKTTNASDRARYVLRVSGAVVDSTFIDQNAGSSTWVHLMKVLLPGPADVSITVSDAMSPVLSGRVLRADAVLFQWTADTSAVAVVDKPAIPQTTSLLNNYPNPFNPSTRVEYLLSSESVVRLSVYDLLGREVAVLENGRKPAGAYTATWNAGAVSGGTYFLVFRAGNIVQTRRLLLLK